VVYSDADAGSLAVEMADETVHIGPSPASESYLRADKIIAACKQTGAEAVHPGFGFLSERAEFARQLEAEGHRLHRPLTPAAIDAMGDKIASKRAAAAAGVSTVPGHVGEIDGWSTPVRISEEIGYPVNAQGLGRRGREGHPHRLVPRRRRGGFPAVRAEAKGPSATTGSLSRSSSPTRATSRSRCWATSTATSSTCSSASALSSAAIRRS
jgi:propionyl-CoA carboxylase alpha chain